MNKRWTKCKRNKLLKITSVIFILGGCLLCGVGFSMAKFDIYALNPEKEEAYQVKNASYPLKDISAIELDVNQSDITIEGIEGDNVLLKYEENDQHAITTSLANKKLKIDRNESFKRNLFKFNWMNFSKLKHAKITLQIPQKYLGDLEVSNGYDDIHISDLRNLKKVNIDNRSGEINLVNIKAESMEVANEYGNIDLKAIELLSNLSMTNRSGHSKLKNISAKDVVLENEYGEIEADTMSIHGLLEVDNRSNDIMLSAITTNRAQIDTSYGDVLLKKWASDELVAKVKNGDINANILGSITDYHVLSNAENGENNLAKESNPTQKKRIDVSTSYGDINVQFAK